MGAACGHEILDVLRRQPLFAALGEADLHTIAERSHCRLVRREALLFREGEPCRGLYLVVTGAVRVYRASRDGREQVLQTQGAGESLGEVSLLDGGPYLAAARAAEDSRVLYLPLAEVQWLCETYPSVARAMLDDLSRRLRSMVRLVDFLSLRSVPARVASALLEYAERGNGAAAQDGVRFTVPRTQEELAAELGTTRESVARALHRLRRDGVIRQRGARVELCDAEALRALAGAGAMEPARSAA
jgi:CRP/FNR family transcriptional regulator